MWAVGSKHLSVSRLFAKTTSSRFVSQIALAMCIIPSSVNLFPVRFNMFREGLVFICLQISFTLLSANPLLLRSTYHSLNASFSSVPLFTSFPAYELLSFFSDLGGNIALALTDPDPDLIPFSLTSRCSKLIGGITLFGYYCLAVIDPDNSLLCCGAVNDPLSSFISSCSIWLRWATGELGKLFFDFMRPRGDRNRLALPLLLFYPEFWLNYPDMFAEEFFGGLNISPDILFVVGMPYAILGPVSWV